MNRNETTTIIFFTLSHALTTNALLIRGIEHIITKVDGCWEVTCWTHDQNEADAMSEFFPGRVGSA
jgi:hypothetical protein